MRRAAFTFAIATILAALPRAVTAQDPPRADSTDAALVAAGKSVFEGKSGGALCVSCHGPKAKGIPGLGPDLTDTKWLHGDGGAAFLQAIVKTGVMKPKAGVLTMPPMGGGKLGEDQLKAVAAYVQSLGKA